MKGQDSQCILPRALDFIVSSEFEFWLYVSPFCGLIQVTFT